MARWFDDCRTATSGSRPFFSFRPQACSVGTIAWYSAVTPSSLKRAAIVPNTGISSGLWLKAS
ncbi:MAG: hypothetical protein FAZ92_02661 [Accumulibacter sp.]|nr:MAG: hypothetical protein FAZ92_02661 [Accumulibacter sp.]